MPQNVFLVLYEFVVWENEENISKVFEHDFSDSHMVRSRITAMSKVIGDQGMIITSSK